MWISDVTGISDEVVEEVVFFISEVVRMGVGIFVNWLFYAGTL